MITPKDSIDHIIYTNDLFQSPGSNNVDDCDIVNNHFIFSHNINKQEITEISGMSGISVLWNESKWSIRITGSGISKTYEEMRNQTFSYNSFNSTFTIPYEFRKKYPTVKEKLLEYFENKSFEIVDISKNDYGYLRFSYHPLVNKEPIKTILSSFIKNLIKVDGEGVLEYNDLKNVNLIDFIKKNKVLKLKVDY